MELDEAKHVLGIIAGRESGVTTVTLNRDAARVVLDYLAEEPEWAWEYVPGWISGDGSARISQGVIAPGYVAQFITEGGEVVRRRVSKFETVTAETAPAPTTRAAGDATPRGEEQTDDH